MTARVVGGNGSELICFRAVYIGEVSQATGAIAMDGQSVADKAGGLAEGANAKLKETLDRAGESVASAGETAKAVADRTHSAGVEAGARIKDAVQKAGDQGGQALRDLSQRGTEAGRYLSETAAAHPLASLLIAAALGYGLARITIR
jgi:hypothetical protein